MIRRLCAVMGVVAMLTLTACSTAVAGSPAAGGGTGDTDSADSAPGFDECGVVDLAELAEWLEVDSMYVTSAEVMVNSYGIRQATCTYYPADHPGATGVKLTYAPGVDPETYFDQWEKNYDNRIPLEVGDRAETIGLANPEIDLKIYLVHAIKGTVGVDLFYSFDSSGKEENGMPVVEEGAKKFTTLLNAVFERLPEELDIQDGEPEGPCADIDLDQADETLQSELTTARTVQRDDGAFNCVFGGESGRLEVSLSKPAKAPENVTHGDVGDGALIRVDPPGGGSGPGNLNAWVAVGDNLVRVTAAYGNDVSGITEARPEDVEFVRAIVEAVGGQD